MIKFIKIGKTLTPFMLMALFAGCADATTEDGIITDMTVAAASAQRHQSAGAALKNRQYTERTTAALGENLRPDVASEDSLITDESVAAANDASEDETAYTLGSFNTTFNPKNKNRSKNILLASEAINDIVIPPGETFSYNETVGPTSRKHGYKLSTIFVKGKMFEGYGGGVCQVSSTLYNAAANAGMTIVERHDHTMPVPYVETGRDAATSYGGIDFKFKNNQPFPVKICSHVDNGELSVTLSAV